MFPRNKCSPLLVAAAHVICDSAVNLKHDISHRACITSCLVKIKIATMKFLTFLTQLFRSVSNDYEMKTKLLVMCAFSSVQINAKMVFFRYAEICAAHPFINTSTATLCTQSIRRCLSSSMPLCVAGGRLYRALGEWVVTSSMTRVIALISPRVLVLTKYILNCSDKQFINKQTNKPNWIKVYTKFIVVYKIAIF